MLNFEYVSKVSCEEKANSYEVLTQADNASGIFSYLDSQWHINPISPTSCEVDYSIRMDFSSSMYSVVVKRFFAALVASITNDFE